jgi:hypothetical protein
MAWLRAIVGAFRWLFETRRRSRFVAVVAGVALAFVPTAWSVFPGWAQWPTFWKALILVVWVLVALLIVVGTDRQSRQLDRLMSRAAEDIRNRREAAGLRAIRQLIDNLPPPIDNRYRATVFGYNEQTDRLVPIADSDPDEPVDEWEPGQGATGYAFQRNEHVVAKGPTVYDGSYGLTPDQQKRYRQYHLVASFPILDESNEPIGALSLLRRRDDGAMDTEEGVNAHVELATLIGSIMVHLLEWAPEGAE